LQRKKNFIASAKNSIRCAQLDEEKSSHVVAHLCLQVHRDIFTSLQGLKIKRGIKGSSLGESGGSECINISLHSTQKKERNPF
jgi:hypothetical protein